jgi:hypothetical protein
MGLGSFISGIFAKSPVSSFPTDMSGDRALRGGLTSSDINGFLSAYGEVSPSYPFAFIDLSKLLALVNPDVSQTVQKISALGNVGHSLDIKAGGDAAAALALEELNNLAKNAFPNHAGADGFINQQFRQIVLTGALCQEMVPSLSLDGVETVYQVKAGSIRFRVENGQFVPVQKTGGKEIALNRNTFAYIPLFSDEDSPYAIPPFLASLRMVMRQEKQWNDIDSFMELWGLLGLSHLKRPLKKSFQENDKEFMERSGKELLSTYDLFRKNLKKGIVVSDADTTLDHHNVSKNAGSVDTILQSTEQQIASGLDIDPAMLGRTYSTTETYATVCYETLLGKIANIQRVIRRANERIYNTHLILRKIPASCSMSFNPSPSLKRYEDAQAEQIRQTMILERMGKGIISPDQAALELGYDEAYSRDAAKENLSVSFCFDKEKGRYTFSRPKISLMGFSKKKALTTASRTK